MGWKLGIFHSCASSKAMEFAIDPLKSFQSSRCSEKLPNDKLPRNTNITKREIPKTNITECEKYIPTNTLRDYAVIYTQNRRYRTHMEDEVVAKPTMEKYLKNTFSTCSFFAVFDGHGGGFCSKYAAQYFHRRFCEILQQYSFQSYQENSKITKNSKRSLFPTFSRQKSKASNLNSSQYITSLTTEEINEIYQQTFLTIDEELSTHEEAETSGTTAVTCFIRKLSNSIAFHIANVGDSRAILYSQGKTTRLTVDHKATNAQEVKRIRDLDGIVFNNRVGGVLSVSRALGHCNEKEFIISTPHLVSGEIFESDENSFLLLTSDGVTDIFTDEELTQFINSRLVTGEKAMTSCKYLVEEAKKRGAKDNLSCILLCF